MKLAARLCIAFAVILPHVALAAASKTAWYDKTVSAFTDAGYVDGGTFAPATQALRAEFVEMTLRLLGGKIHVPFGEPVFDDANLESPFFASFQEGGRGKWVTGVGNCAGSHPCQAAPLKSVNRAEAAALIIRAFGITATSPAPTFSDNLRDQWYTDFIATAASRCILQGDSGKNRVRPGDPMNRAEMLAMLKRAMNPLDYPHCATESDVPLPLAQKEFSIVMNPIASSMSSSASSAVTRASSSSPVSSAAALSSSFSSAASSSHSSSLAQRSSTSSSEVESSSPSSSSLPSSSAQTQDPHYTDLLTRFQQYIADYSSLLARARSADGDSAVQLLTVLRSQIDLLNQLYPFVEIAKSRVLSGSESSSVASLQNRIETGFAQAPR